MPEGGVKLDVVAIGAHPDDVELGCGGTLARLAREGRRVGILHLTRGERGTRGTPEERETEARRAAEILGAAVVDFLDFGDGGLRHGEGEEDRLIAWLRQWRPTVVLAPPPSDRHPDHARAHRLVEAAAFYAGLVRRGEGEPHRPQAMFSYMQHDPFVPSFIVDVTATWETKKAALAAYRSQLFQPGMERPGAATKIATSEFSQAIEGRARHFGLLMGVAFGEPFWSRLPLAVDDLFTILPKGVP